MRQVHEPPLSLSPEIVIPSACPSYDGPLSRVLYGRSLVLLPESFRGGCSFGTTLTWLLPTNVRQLSGRSHSWQEANVATSKILVAPVKHLIDRKSTRMTSSHSCASRMPSPA